MKLQKQLSKKVGDKVYYKYVLVFPEKVIKDAGFKEGFDLEVDAKKGEVKLRRKNGRY